MLLLIDQPESLAPRVIMNKMPKLARVRLRKLSSWGGASFLAGVVIATSLAVFPALPNLRGPYVIPFLSYFLLASLAYILAVWRLNRDLPPIWVIWGFAVLFRLILLGTSPTLSDDVYRYIWDGQLVNQGINPYAHPVNAPALDAYQIPFRELVNHNWMASPYLPAAQLLFASATRFAPPAPLTFQIIALLLDLATGWLVMDILGLLDLPIRRVLLYLWNPLVVVEFAHGSHIDIWMIFLVMLAFWFMARAWSGNPRAGWLRSASMVALAAATLTKGLPVLLAPLFLRRWGWRRLAYYTAIVAGVSALFAYSAGWGLSGPLDGRGLFGALRIYARHWNYNSGIYHWLEVYLTGYQTAGAVPPEAVGEARILLAKLITTGLLGLVVLGSVLWAWRLDDPDRGSYAKRTLSLLRLTVIPVGAYLLLTTTVHPWYVTLILPFIPFLLPGETEAHAIERFAWPWLYFSWAAGLSYLTYLDTSEFHEYPLVRQVEYIPLYLLLIWAIWPEAKRCFRFFPQPSKRLCSDT